MLGTPGPMTAPDGWIVYDALNGVHVVPVADLVMHAVTDECVCGPRIEFFAEDGSAYTRPFYSHHSADGREHFEK